MSILERLGVEIKEERLVDDEFSLPGSFYRLRGKLYVLLVSLASVEEKIGVLVNLLQSFKTEEISIPPKIREMYFKREGK